MGPSLFPTFELPIFLPDTAGRERSLPSIAVALAYLEQVQCRESLYRSKHELIFVYRVGLAPHLDMVELGKHGRNRTNVWDYASVNSTGGSRREDLALHPTVKSTGLVADAIQDVTRHGGRT